MHLPSGNGKASNSRETMNTSQEKQKRFMKLFEPVQRNLERFVLAMTRDTETARDVIAETVMIAYERFDTLRSPQAFLSFLFTIAVRVHRSYERKGARTEPLNEETMAGFLSAGTSPETAADVAAVYEALQRLPEKQREAVVLFEVMGVPMKEICEIQGGTLTAVKVRISRGRKKLASLLGVDDAEETKTVTMETTPKEHAPHLESNQFYSIGVRP